MSNTLVALLTALGSGTWVYTKALRRTGGNQPTALTAGGAVGVLVFVVALTVLSFIV